MHAGSPLTSFQLGETLRLLREAGGRLVTTAEIAAVTRGQAVHSDIAACRQWLRNRDDGEYIPRAEHVETTPEGRKVYGYRLVSAVGVSR